jgi:hypothetical protein
MSVLTCACQFKVILSILRKCMYIAHPDTCLCDFLGYVYLLIDCSILTWKEEPQLFDMKPPIRNQSWTVCQHSNWADIKHTPMEAQFKSTWPMLIPRGSTMPIYRPSLCGDELASMCPKSPWNFGCFGGTPTRSDYQLVKLGEVWGVGFFGSTMKCDAITGHNIQNQP